MKGEDIKWDGKQNKEKKEKKKNVHEHRHPTDPLLYKVFALTRIASREILVGGVGTTGPGVNRPAQLHSYPQPTTHTHQPIHLPMSRKDFCADIYWYAQNSKRYTINDNCSNTAKREESPTQ